MTTIPTEPDAHPDPDPDGVPGDDPAEPTDPDQQKPAIVTIPERA